MDHLSRSPTKSYFTLKNTTIPASHRRHLNKEVAASCTSHDGDVTTFIWDAELFEYDMSMCKENALLITIQYRDYSL